MAYVNSYVQTVGVLNTLNKNLAEMQTHMLRVAKGMRINSVADDPSGWAIGTRMGIEIGGLGASIQNAQRSRSLLKVAEGAAQSSLDLMRHLKSKAIEAASDTATDSDRRNIQKLFDQYADQLTDNALVTYNGKFLLDGSHSGVALETTQAYTNESLREGVSSATKLTDLERRDGSSLNILDSDKVSISYVKDGKTFSKSSDVGTLTLGDVFALANAADPDSGNVFDTSGMDGTAYIGKDASGADLYTPDYGKAVTVKAADPGKNGNIAGFTISITDKDGNVKKAANASLDAFSETIQGVNSSPDNSLYIASVDTSGGQKIALGDLRPGTLGVTGTDGTVINVSNREGANAAINVLDNAVNRVLDQVTSIGASIMRMDYSIANMNTQSENLTAAMSTIMDADMAREMTAYAKANVLVQAAQAMLGKSNQSQGWWLSLLGVDVRK